MARFPWPVFNGKSNKRRNRHPQKRLMMESLEGRQMLSTVALMPVKDNTLIENASGTRSNGAGDIFVGLNADQNRIRRGLVDFDIAASVPAGATINSVSLTMYVEKTKVGNSSVELHKVLADWGEAGSSGDGNGGGAQTGDATWVHTFYNSQSWASAGGDFSPTVSGVQTIGASGITYTWTSTAQMVADVQDWLDNPNNNHGWLLKGVENQRSSKRFGSKETVNAGHRPILLIDYSEGNANPPVITSSNTASVPENTTGVLTVTATDADGDTPTFSKTGGADAAAFTLNTNTGVLTFSSAPDFEQPSDVGGNNVYEVEVTASDGTNNSLPQTIVVTVTDVNENPSVSGADIVGRDTNGNWWTARSTGAGFSNSVWGNWAPGSNWVDVQLADVDGDGDDDVVGRDSSGAWYVGRNTGTNFVTQQWGQWSNAVTWDDVQVADVNGDGKDDIVGRTSGQWWVARSTGQAFQNSLWGRWSNLVVWNNVLIADVDGDGRDDIVGRTSGQWWVAHSNGSKFDNEYWGSWSNAVTWQDVQVGDFDGDGRDDIAGRTNGQWWLSRSQGSAFSIEFWGRWSNAVTWSDVRIGDFDGDGRSDIAGRTNGQWWVSRSQGSYFSAEYWGRWSSGVTWLDVMAADLNDDGKTDLVARTGGQWWALPSTGSSFLTEYWGGWPATTWTDVAVGQLA